MCSVRQVQVAITTLSIWFSTPVAVRPFLHFVMKDLIYLINQPSQMPKLFYSLRRRSAYRSASEARFIGSGPSAMRRNSGPHY
jgi:hypothetical protein